MALQAVKRADAKYQTEVSECLAQLCKQFEDGKVDGLYVISREWNSEGETELVHRRAAMRDNDVSWSAISVLLSTHLEWR